MKGIFVSRDWLMTVRVKCLYVAVKCDLFYVREAQ